VSDHQLRAATFAARNGINHSAAHVISRRASSQNSTTKQIKPDFFIVGAPKCGTSALAEYLVAHPDIFMARKEMHFFGNDLRFSKQFYRRDETEYLAEFSGWNGQSRIGEASVWYLFSETAANEIKRFNPESRIVVLLREPVDMIYSLFHWFRFDGNEPLRTFTEALNAENSRRAGLQTSRQTYFAQGLIYRKTALYTAQLRRYFEIFGRERVHVMLYEDLARDAAGVYRNALKFLGVNAEHTLPQFPRVNPAQVVKSPALRAVLNDNAVRSALLAIRPTLPHFVFNALHKIERKLSQINSSAQKPPPIDPELRSQLRRDFAPEVERLSELIGRDLTHWSREELPAPPQNSAAQIAVTS
jgi:hypothetical protein